MLLRDVAHARCGDKGNTASIAVVAYDRRDFERLERVLTIARVRAHFGNRVIGKIERFELPAFGAFNFVLHDALGGGVTRSLALDPHGKSLSSIMLGLPLLDDEWG